MKTFKKIACSFLALGLVMGLTACAPKTFEHQKLIDFLEDQDFDDSKELEDYYYDYSDIITYGRTDDDGAYVHCEGKDAQEVYDRITNRFGNYPDYDVEEATTFCFRDGKGFAQGYLLSFEDIKDAEKFFKKYIESMPDDGEDGDEKGYTYYIYSSTSSRDIESYSCVYLRGNTVLIMISVGVDADLTEDFREAFGVKSPTEL